MHGNLLTEDVERIVDKYIITNDVTKQIELADELKDLLEDYEDIKTPRANSYPNLRSTHKKSTNNEEKKLAEEIKKQLKKIDKNSEDTETPKDANAEIEKEISNEKGKLVEDIERQKTIMKKKDFNETSSNDSKMIFRPEQQHYSTAKNLQTAISKLRNDLDNKTTYNQKRGILNIRKAMVSNSYQTNDFKRFIPSRLSKTRLGVSIFIDSSGSMTHRNYEIAISGGWSIARALEKLGSMTKVYEFSSCFRVIKDFNDSTKDSSWGRDFCGSTNILDALRDAKDSTKELRKTHGIKNHMMLILTDGAFNNNAEVEVLAKELKKEGIYVCLIRINDYGSFYYSSHNDRNAYNKIIELKTFNQLTQGMTDIVRDVQKSVILNVKRGGY
jgi:Mg-chelatase subunit ChlD